MNLIIGIIAGGLAGWFAYGVLNAIHDKGLKASLLIGSFGGMLGTQLAPLLNASASGEDGQFNVFSLVLAVACAVGALIVVNMIARRGNA